MVHASVMKTCDENNSVSHYFVAESSISWYQLSVGIQTSCVLFAVEFCVSLVCVLRKMWTEISGKSKAVEVS